MTLARAIAALVNVAILVTAAKALCPSFGCANPPVVNINSLTVNEAAGVMGVVYGTLAGTIFAITLLSSGIASSTTGTLAGQAIMEGLLGTKVNIYVRRIITRFINVIPTFTAISLGLQPLSLLVYSQVVLSLMIPLPMVPLLYYTSRRKFMGEFVNHWAATIIALVLAGTIIALVLAGTIIALVLAGTIIALDAYLLLTL